MKLPQLEASVIRVDNKSAIELAKNPTDHERTKHIDVRFHFIREQIKKQVVRVEYVKTNDQAADIFTKALSKPLFEKGKQMLGMKNLRDLKLREDVGNSNSQVSNPHSTNPHNINPKHSGKKMREKDGAREEHPGKACSGRQKQLMTNS